MDRRITSRLNMANAFQQVCVNHAANVALVPAFDLLVRKLAIIITALQGMMQSLSGNDQGLRTDKINWKETLALKLSIVCGAGVAYARSVSDVVLAGKFDFAVSMLVKLRDTELIETARSIIALQGTVAERLLDYGITASFMGEVQTALDEFERKNPLPVVNVYTEEAEREAALNKAYELSDFVLNEMMKAALIYKVLAPTFFQALENASRISKVGVRHDEIPNDLTTASGAGKEVTSATIEQKSAQEHPADLLENAVQEIGPAEQVEESTANLAAPSLNGV